MLFKEVIKLNDVDNVVSATIISTCLDTFQQTFSDEIFKMHQTYQMLSSLIKPSLTNSWPQLWVPLYS